MLEDLTPLILAFGISVICIAAGRLSTRSGTVNPLRFPRWIVATVAGAWLFIAACYAASRAVEVPAIWFLVAILVVSIPVTAFNIIKS